jgi:arabinofuranosyltransferase
MLLGKPYLMLARLLGAFAVLLAAVRGQRYLGYVCDDAVISFRSVANAGLGHGLVYNVGERVETYTNLGFVWLLWLAQALGLDLFAAATWLGYGASVGAVAATWWLARGLLPAHVAWAPPLVVAGSTTLVGQAGSGLETSTCALFVTLGLARLVRECEAEANTNPAAPRRQGVALLLLGLASIVRIDTVLVFAGAWFLKTCWCGPRHGRTRAVDTLLLALGLLLPTLFRWLYYGSPLPNPVMAKFGLAPDPRIYKAGLHYVLDWLRVDLGAPLLVLGLGLALAAGRRAQAFVVLGGGWLFYVVTSGGDHMPYQRFLAPMLPALVTTTFVGLWHAFGERLQQPRLHALAALATVAALVLVPAVQTLSRGNVPERSFAGERYRREVGEFFAAEAKRRGGTLVAAGGAAGYMGHFGGPAVRFVDILGLCDAHIARHGRRDPRMPAGHQMGDGVYVLQQRPDYVVFGSSTPGDLWQRDGSADLLQRITAVGPEAWAEQNDHLWAVSERDLLAAPEFVRDYELVQVQLPSGRPFRLCQRRAGR